MALIQWIPTGEASALGDPALRPQFVCEVCELPITDGSDHVVWVRPEDHGVSDFEFRHKRCDPGGDGTSWVPIATFLHGLRDFGTFTPSAVDE